MTLNKPLKTSKEPDGWYLIEIDFNMSVKNLKLLKESNKEISNPVITIFYIKTTREWMPPAGRLTTLAVNAYFQVP
jgi:hypothetical protein